MPISTVGAAQSIVTRSASISVEDPRRLDLAQADVRRADRGDDPDERPAVGVEHRQRPQVAIGRPHRQVHQRADDVHLRVAVRDHHALRPRRRAARVVDGQQIALVDLRPLERPARLADERLVVEPPVARRPFERDEVPDAGQLRPDAVEASR